MTLCETLVTTATLRDLVLKTALLLESKDCIDKIVCVDEITEQPHLGPDQKDSIQPAIFKFKWLPQFDELATEVAKTTSKEVKENVAITGRSIRVPKAREPGTSAEMLLTNEAMLTSDENRGFLLQPVPISDDARQRIIQHIVAHYPKIGKIRSGTLLSTELRLWSDANKEIQSDAKFGPHTVSLIPGGVGLRTEPPMAPFLMIPFCTERRQDNEDVV